MEFAKNVLISVTCFKHLAVFRFAFLRSDLSCHHTGINLRNLSAQLHSVPKLVGYAGFTLT